MQRLYSFATAAILVLLCSGTANGYPTRYPRSMGWGPVIGVTANPDQFHFGARVDVGDIAPRLRLQPNFEFGVGDNETIGAMGFDTEYRFDTSTGWTPYLGGGIGISFVGREDRYGFDEGSDTTAGLSLIGGLERAVSGGNRFFLESKIGLIDAPDLEISMGWTFYH